MINILYWIKNVISGKYQTRETSEKRFFSFFQNNYLYPMKLFLLTLVLVSLCVAGIAIKILFKKDGRFSGTCASQSPFLNKEGEACGICGKLPEEQDCKNPELSKT